MRYLDEPHGDMTGSDLGFVPAAELGEATDWHAPVQPPAPPAALGRWTRTVIIATAVWSVFELPWEIYSGASTRDVIACIAAKLLWVALVGFVLAGSRVARIVYAFLCTIGLMAVAFGLPVEFRMFPLGFVLSLVECALKATAFVCLVSTGIYPEEE